MMSKPDPRSGNPFTLSLERLRGEVDSLLEVAWSNGERALGAFGIGGKAGGPEIDVVETDDQVTVTVDLPGVEPQTVDVALAGNMLTIKGERPTPAACPSQVVHLSERRRGTFHRSIPVPVPVDPEKVAAESRNGTLTIRLAKQQSAVPRHIPVASKAPGDSVP